MDTILKWLKSKTLWINILGLVAAKGDQVLQLGFIKDKDDMAIAMTILALINILNRKFTTKPIEEK